MRRIALLALALAVASLWAQQKQPAPPAGLAVTKATLHFKQEEGPAIAGNYEYYAGELLYLSFRISGFKTVKDSVDLRWQLVGVDPEGLLLAPPANGAVKEEIGYTDKDWLPKVAYTLPLPAQLPPGVYKLKIQVADENAQAAADREVEFKVGGRPLPRPERFSVLSLGFYRQESDRQPMEKAAYRAGETLLARFQMAGFQMGEKNRFDVSYGLSILGASGKVLYSQDDAAADSGAPFYPRRMLNGALTLNLTAGVQPAEYTLVVKAKDRVGQTEAEARARFQVVP